VLLSGAENVETFFPVSREKQSVVIWVEFVAFFMYWIYNHVRDQSIGDFFFENTFRAIL